MSGVLHILLVEDNAGDARLISEMLRDATQTGPSFVVHRADTLTSGIEQLRQGQVDVVLLDLGLPESVGLETLQRLRAHAPKLLPVIVLSGLSDVDVALQSLQSGAQDYLVKGRVDSDLLARSIRYAIERRQAEEGRRRAEGESEELRRLLEEREQMLAEREEMMRLLAHEVRQPLNNASAALEGASSTIAASQTQLPSKVREPLERARSVLDHVIGTLNNTLAAASLLTAGGGTSADSDLQALIGLVVRDIGAEQRARVVVECRTAVRTVQLQPMLMRLALCNLLVNALAYSPPDTQVRLRVTDSDEPPALQFEVCDEGAGVPAELMPVIFDRGTRGANTRAGTGAGLGLYIVRKVVAAHQGSVEILPNVPRGTIFRVTIPQGLAA